MTDVRPVERYRGRRIEAFGEVRNLTDWSREAGLERTPLRQRLARFDPEIAIRLPPCARVNPDAEPGAPGAWTWYVLPYDEDPWARAFVAAHPDGATLEEIGAALGLVRERVRQLEESAIRKCRRAAQKLGAEALAVLEEWELARRRVHTWEAP